MLLKSVAFAIEMNRLTKTIAIGGTRMEKAVISGAACEIQILKA